MRDEAVKGHKGSSWPVVCNYRCVVFVVRTVCSKQDIRGGEQ